MVGYFLFFVFLFFSALFSASEIAFISSNRLKMHLRRRADKGSKFSDGILQNSPKLLTITLVGNNTANVAASSLAVMLLAPHLSEALIPLATTIMLLLFGEIFPKTVAQQIPNRLIKFVPPFLNFAYFLLYPLIKLVGLVTQILVRVLGGKQNDVDIFFKKRDLPMLIREHASLGKFSKDEELLINRAIKISDKRINEVMIPRTDIFAMDINTPYDEVVSAVIQTHYARIPFFEDDLDHIVGLLHAHDLFTGEKDIRKLLRPALFFPESGMAVDVLQKLRQASRSVAIIIDEFGGTAGMITLEDFIEKLLGEISDEFDFDEDTIFQQSDGNYILSGRAEIDDLREKFGLDIPEGDYVTIAGFIESRLGYIPKPKEIIHFPLYRIEILKSDAIKISQLKIIKIKATD
jgi:putative hemolysin